MHCCWIWKKNSSPFIFKIDHPDEKILLPITVQHGRALNMQHRARRIGTSSGNIRVLWGMTEWYVLVVNAPFSAIPFRMVLVQLVCCRAPQMLIYLYRAQISVGRDLLSTAGSDCALPSRRLFRKADLHGAKRIADFSGNRWIERENGLPEVDGRDWADHHGRLYRTGFPDDRASVVSHWRANVRRFDVFVPYRHLLPVLRGCCCHVSLTPPFFISLSSLVSVFDLCCRDTSWLCVTRRSMPPAVRYRSPSGIDDRKLEYRPAW